MRDALTRSIERMEADLAYGEWAAAYLPIDDNVTPIRPVPQDQQRGAVDRLRAMAAHPAGKRRATGVVDPDRYRLAQIVDLELYASRRRQLDAIDEPSDFELAILETTDELTDVLLAKHQDYGPGNIAGSPGGPLNGLRVRLYDKLARINNLVDTGAGAVNEPLRDSFLDLANYALIGLLVLDGRWPTT